MKKFATPLIFLLIFPTATLARNSQQPGIPAGECPGLARACTATARELIAARKVITACEADMASHDERIAIARKEIETLKSVGALQTERARKLEEAIAAEEEAKAALLKEVDLQKRRIGQIEKQLGRAHKFALIAGAAAVVGIVIAVGK